MRRTATIVIVLMATFAASQASIVTADEEEKVRLPWQAFLWRAAKNTGCAFTLELATDRPKIKHRDDETIHADPRFSSIDELLKFTSQKLYWLSLARDERNPKRIHVIDKRLIGLRRYSLDEVVDVEFAGVPEDLEKYLHKTLPFFKNKDHGDWRQMFDDHWTDIAVSAKQQTVRRVLSDAVPMECYQPIIWRAETTIKTGEDPSTMAQFYGLSGFDAEGRWWPWWEWLKRAGEAHECFFTIETMYRASSDPACCPAFFDDRQKYQSIDELLADLSKRMPNLVAIKSPSRPGIIHIVDRDLPKLRDYPLERRVDMHFAGTPDELLLALKKSVPSVGPPTFVTTDEPEEIDAKTQVIVNVRQERIRNMLSDSVPLPKQGSRVLWHARTWNRESGPQTQVEFRSPH